ncbi:hypothetical protein AOLI_G00242750 [Acnodon oligacanthus]
MKTLNAAAVMRLFIILVLAVHMAPGVRSGNKASEIEAEASLHEKDADSDQLLENERLEKAAAEAEAEAIQELMNIHLDEAEEKVENHLAADETTEAFLTEAEVEAVKTIMPQSIDQREAELLGCEVISFADTEPEAPTVTTQTFMDEVDTPTDHPLAGNESHEDADVEVEAEDRNTLTDTQLDDTKATFSQTLAEIEILKKDTPEIDTRKNQEKKKTRRGTRGKGRKIHYKKKGEQVM